MGKTLKFRRLWIGMAAVVMSAVLSVSGVVPCSADIARAGLLNTHSPETEAYLMNMPIYTAEGETVYCGDFSEDYIVFLFSVITNNFDYMSVLNKAQEDGISIRKVFLACADNSEPTYDLDEFLRVNARHLTFSSPSKQNDTFMWECGRTDGITNAIYEPLVFVLDANRELVFASTDWYEGRRVIDCFKEFWQEQPVQNSYDAGFKEDSITLFPGDTYQQTAKAYGYTGPLDYSSSNKKIATVSSDGTVTAKKEGKTTITASTPDGDSYSYKVIVTDDSLASRVKQIKASVIKPGMTDLQKARALHDWMVENIDYDYENYLNDSIPTSSACELTLVKKKGVCAGYAISYEMLLNEVGIKNKYIVGTAGEGNGSHAWNIVRIDGKWYHVDVTWDDPVYPNGSSAHKPRYTYFMKSSNYMKQDHGFKDKKAIKKCKRTDYDRYTEDFFPQ